MCSTHGASDFCAAAIYVAMQVCCHTDHMRQRSCAQVGGVVLALLSVTQRRANVASLASDKAKTVGALQEMLAKNKGMADVLNVPPSHSAVQCLARIGSAF